MLKKIKCSMKYIVLLASLIFVLLDQWFKYLAIKHLSAITTIPLIKNILHLTYLENKGAAFGIFEGRLFILVGITALIVLILIILILSGKVKNNLALWSMSLIIAGGIGNLIDRVARHYVIDYIHVKLINFPIFNFADCCVVVGVILFVVFFLFFDKPEVKVTQEDKKEHTTILELSDIDDKD